MPCHRVVALALGEISPLDLGAVAEIFGIDPELTPDWYDFSFCAVRPGQLSTMGGLRLMVDRDMAELDTADTIVVLPVARFVHERPGAELLAPLIAAASRGCRIVSVCLGTFVLAAAGLLDGRRATTHWRFCGALSRAYPRVHVVADMLYVDEGVVLTSGGVAAGIDACLHVVRNDHGAEVANGLARRLVFGPHRDGGQAQFIEQPVADSSDPRLAGSMAWALEHLPENPSIHQIAAVAHMSRRTFYRMFHATTGTTPHRWLVSQQVILARRLLETSPLSVAEVAGRSGFGDVSALRRHFTGQVGVSPATYRRRFGQRQAHPAR